jgi:hypothetical protein
VTSEKWLEFAWGLYGLDDPRFDQAHFLTEIEALDKEYAEHLDLYLEHLHEWIETRFGERKFSFEVSADARKLLLGIFADLSAEGWDREINAMLDRQLLHQLMTLAFGKGVKAGATVRLETNSEIYPDPFVIPEGLFTLKVKDPSAAASLSS